MPAFSPFTVVDQGFSLQGLPGTLRVEMMDQPESAVDLRASGGKLVPCDDWQGIGVTYGRRDVVAGSRPARSIRSKSFDVPTINTHGRGPSSPRASAVCLCSPSAWYPGTATACLPPHEPQRADVKSALPTPRTGVVARSGRFACFEAQHVRPREKEKKTNSPSGKT